LAANVYVVFTPIAKPSDNSSIEDFFEPALLEMKINGKSFNADNEGLDKNTEYGKADFATQVVRPNIAKINFDKFDPILARLEGAMEAHIKKHVS
ncbi:MAG: hypothetical protein B7Z03_04455, partial [Hydrogenophilales bacterium 32-62-9]